MARLLGSMPAFIARIRSLSTASITLYIPGNNCSFVEGDIWPSRMQRQYSPTKYCICWPAKRRVFFTSSLSSLRRLFDDRAPETVGLQTDDSRRDSCSAEERGRGSVDSHIQLGSVLPKVLMPFV